MDDTLQDQHVEAPHHTGRSYDEMLCPPSTSTSDVTMQRASASYASLDSKYRITSRHYERQYAQTYFCRLTMMQPLLKERATNRWPGLTCYSILEIPEGEECWVLGTLYKDMKLKPSILDEYTKARGVQALLQGATSFCSDDDTVVLEDGGGRMVLQGPGLKVQQLVTGIVLALRGMVCEDGSFAVKDVCFAGPRPLPTAVTPMAICGGGAAGASSDDKYVALVSGLMLGSTRCDFLKLQLALDFLTGNLGSSAEQQLAGRIVRLVIAGGTVGQVEGAATATPFSRPHAAAMQPIKDMDMYCSELAAAMPVDVMPGAEDPANVALPQQPLHKCLFPGASGYSSFLRVSNPHEFNADDVRFLGTSGQNFEDVAKYSRHDSRLAVMEAVLRWGHMAPTAPDTLACYPFDKIDPFILKHSPHVLFAGNQPAFETSVFHGDGGLQVRLISIPSFAKTGTVVLVNLRTLLCHPMTFQG